MQSLISILFPCLALSGMVLAATIPLAPAVLEAHDEPVQVQSCQSPYYSMSLCCEEIGSLRLQCEEASKNFAQRPETIDEHNQICIGKTKEAACCHSKTGFVSRRPPYGPRVLPNTDFVSILQLNIGLMCTYPPAT